MRTSKPASTAARRRTPLRGPLQPRSRTVATSNAVSSVSKGCATDSSTSIRKVRHSISSHCKDSDRLLTAHGRESVEKLFQRIARLEIIKKVVYRHARTDKHELSTHDLRIAVDHLTDRHPPRIPREHQRSMKLSPSWSGAAGP